MDPKVWRYSIDYIASANIPPPLNSHEEKPLIRTVKTSRCQIENLHVSLLCTLRRGLFSQLGLGYSRSNTGSVEDLLIHIVVEGGSRSMSRSRATASGSVLMKSGDSLVKPSWRGTRYDGHRPIPVARLIWVILYGAVCDIVPLHGSDGRCDPGRKTFQLSNMRLQLFNLPFKLLDPSMGRSNNTLSTDSAKWCQTTYRARLVLSAGSHSLSCSSQFVHRGSRISHFI